ncbi:MAG: polyketide cyclase/dehydrase and lipid transport [Leptospira sp.]|jgi:hypothetical protein|nr:polyketide cyclase/dehydrase and lipid transport [Leptospira sp.]
MILTQKETVIHKPIDFVFDYLYTLENQSEYNTSIKSASRNETVGPLPSFTIEINFALFQLKEIYKVIEIQKPHLFIARCDNSLLSFEDKYEFKSVEDGTFVKITDSMELKGLLRLSEGLVKNNLSEQMGANLMRVKQILESKP